MRCCLQYKGILKLLSLCEAERKYLGLIGKEFDRTLVKNQKIVDMRQKINHANVLILLKQKELYRDPYHGTKDPANLTVENYHKKLGRKETQLQLAHKNLNRTTEEVRRLRGEIEA